MRLLCGIPEGKHYVVPTPVDDEEETRKAKDGTQFWSPDWEAGLKKNTKFIEAAMDLVIVEQKVSVQYSSYKVQDIKRCMAGP